MPAKGGFHFTVDDHAIMTKVMAKIFPFSGVFYNKKMAPNLSKVMTPPYDVISKEAQENFYNTHPYNCIRLILGKEFPGDNEHNNKYTRANAFFNAWLKNGIMQHDDEESIYAYEQRFKFKGKLFVRLGFISLFKLEELEAGRVYPHENTLTKPKQDRLDLIKATATNFESIFSLYIDKEDKISKLLKKNIKRKPIIEVKDGSGFHSRIWKITSKPVINKITKEMSNKQVYIADGHHRYEASLKYRNEMRTRSQKSTGDEPYNFIMMYFTNVYDKGLLVLPIHRLVQNLNLKEKIHMENRLVDYFDIENVPFSKKTEKTARRHLMKLLSAAKEGEHFIGMYSQGDNKYLVLKLKSEKLIDKYIVGDKPRDWKKLDVTILHSIVIRDILGISDGDIASENAVKYVHNDDEAFDLVKEGKFQLAFLLNPTKVEQIVSVADKYEKMPQKSTFFYPKLLTGLVMYKMPNPEKFSF
jgi:uncharacterized protein (DUF1015 family)